MRRILAIFLTVLWTGIATAQSSNTYNNPPAGNPNLAHVGVTNPPAPVLGGPGSTGGSTTYTYAVVAYGHDASGNLLPTLMGASATVTTALATLDSTNLITVTTQANPGTAQYDFLKFRNGSWQSICLAVAVFSFTADGAACTDQGQVPQPYTLPIANNTIDLISPFAAIGNLNVSQNSSPINQAPPQTANYNAQGFAFNNLGCPGTPGDALSEGCAIGAFAPGIVNSSSGALNGSLGLTNPSTVNATGLTVSNNTTLNGATNINGNGSGGINNLPIGTLTPAAIAATTIKMAGTGAVGCVQADLFGNFSITNAACGTGGGGGNPAGSANVLQTYATSTTFGAYAGSGPLASHNFGNQITNTGTLLGAQPAFSDISGTCQVSQGCTGATAAGATAANNIGALAVANNLGDSGVVAATMRTNLGLGTAATQPLPTAGTPGNFSTLEQLIPHTLSTTSATVTCTATSGTYPSQDIYQGKLSGNNVTYTLPPTAQNCINGDFIGFFIVQDASHTVSFTNGTGTVLANAICPAMPTGNDMIGEYYFTLQKGTTTPSWVEHCGIPGQATPFPLLLNQQVGNPVLTSSPAGSTPVDIVTYSMPGGTLGTTHSVDLEMFGQYNNSTSADTPTLTVSYGGQNLFNGNVNSMSSSASGRVIRIWCHLASNGTTSGQQSSCHTTVSTAVAQDGTTASSLWDVTSQNTGMTVDSTASQSYKVTYNDTSSGNSTIKVWSAYYVQQ